MSALPNVIGTIKPENTVLTAPFSEHDVYGRRVYQLNIKVVLC